MTCSDGTFQTIFYHSGVGSTPTLLSQLLGGAFGVGIAENIREVYSYICANYVDGDEIVLVGFSRGAYTARAVAGMISDLGLLTRDGMEYFYPVFKDMQNWMDPGYEDEFPQLPFENKPKGPHAKEEYRTRLVQANLTRWYNTTLSTQVEHGFHALALDESRNAFGPTLWERLPEQRDSTDLRQVWFPGSHINVGGGEKDQGVSNITLAWMMDQLASIGCEFQEDSIDKIHSRNIEYYKKLQPVHKSGFFGRWFSYFVLKAQTKERPWALKPIWEGNKPIRPWSLHTTVAVDNLLYRIIGVKAREPGLYKKINPQTGRPTQDFLVDTNERIHPSVRVRLACEGLGPNDSGLWHCPSLLKDWRPRLVNINVHDPVSKNASWGPSWAKAEGRSHEAIAKNEIQPNSGNEAPEDIDICVTLDRKATPLRWVWEYVGKGAHAPYETTMVEEKMGPFEIHLLNLARGSVPVHEFAKKQDASDFKAVKRLVTKSSFFKAIWKGNPTSE
ncbi:hypothetical protein SLS62_003783 [Diatrype stigma]|uniref:T6SS Phospholipase effector Tle1-like catalytic domain-containing protein n=1 Tax=Diatrype stigma TaxID=117547 RepID=A0AAN9YR27_9PEZI